MSGAATTEQEDDAEMKVGTTWSQQQLDELVTKFASKQWFEESRELLEKEQGEEWTAEDDDREYAGPIYRAYAPPALKPVKMTMLKDSPDKFIVEVENVSLSYMNQLRQKALTQLPSMTIETVIIIENNTGQSIDEYLAHRLGLLTIKVDPRLFDDYNPATDKQTSRNTLVFSIDVQCMPKADAPTVGSPEERFEHTLLYNRDVRWHPVGDQEERLKAHAVKMQLPFEPVHMIPSDGSITRFGAGQRIHLIALAHKGTQSVHAKFSPIAAPRFRQYPSWEFSPAMVDERAELLVKTCKANVFGIQVQDMEDIVDFAGQRRAVTLKTPTVLRPLNCTLCLECTVHHPELVGQVKMNFSRSRFVFTLESNGILPAREYWNMLLELMAPPAPKNKASLSQ